MYTYTAEQLKEKTFSELKSIARDMALIPLGDRRCRQNWTDVIVGAQLPLLKLLDLEVSPVVEKVKPVIESIEVQHQEPIEVDQVQEPIEVQRQEPPIESKFGRIIYPKPTVKPIAPAAETSPGVTEGDRLLVMTEDAAETSPSVSEGDRPLVLTKDAAETSPSVSEGDRPLVLIENAALISVGVEIQAEPIELGKKSLTQLKSIAKNLKLPFGGIRKKSIIKNLILWAYRTDYPAYVAAEDAKNAAVVIQADIEAGDRLAAGAPSPSDSAIQFIQAVKISVEIESTQAAKNSPGVVESDRPLVVTEDATETLEANKNSPSVSFDVEEFQQTHAAEIENYFASFTEASKPPNQGDNGRDRLETEPKLSQSAIVPTVKNSPGVSRKSSTAHQLLDLFKSSAVILKNSPTTETEAETLESAIGLAAKNLIDAEADQNPILTGITFSADFLARYSPPQLENIHYQSEADGQLNLLDFEVESVDEPPDPDDFESLNEFREAIALWEAQHPEPLEISLDSFCEWAPCPDDWYEPAPSEVLELSPTIKSSSTCKFLQIPDSYFHSCKFLIPVFDAWCDRANRQNDTDEPPDREIFARLPKPKPPSFPPMSVVVGDRANRQNNTDEPPDTGIFARLPKPKPPSFPPMSVVVGDRANHIKKFGRNAKLLSGRSSPGGDELI